MAPSKDLFVSLLEVHSSDHLAEKLLACLKAEIEHSVTWMVPLLTDGFQLFLTLFRVAQLSISAKSMLIILSFLKLAGPIERVNRTQPLNEHLNKLLEIY